MTGRRCSRHPRTAENLYITPSGHEYCRACRREWQQHDRQGKCRYLTPWGRCQQPRLEGSDHCAFHAYWLTQPTAPDAFYHEKIARGLTQPVGSYLGHDELRALTSGKYHGDGRRLDAYVVEDPDDSVPGGGRGVL